MVCEDNCINDQIPRDDPQVIPKGCYIFNNASINDSFNGLTILNNNPNTPNLKFLDPYKNQDVGYCSKFCIDFMFSYFAMVNGVDCRCGDKNALQSYIQVNDNNCNIPCNFLTDKGNVTYPCGGNGYYTVYKAERADYNSPANITILDKLNIMNNIDNVPHYKGCFEDNKVCGQRILGDDCDTPITTIDECIDYCRKGNFKYAGAQSRAQCFCGNSFDSIGRLKSSVDCSASCPGNSSQICGGEWLLSIYEVPTLTNTPLPPTPPSNKGLIIGLSVGLGTLIIVIMVRILIYRKHKRGPKDPISEFDLANLDNVANVEITEKIKNLFF